MQSNMNHLPPSAAMSLLRCGSRICRSEQLRLLFRGRLPFLLHDASECFKAHATQTLLGAGVLPSLSS